MAKQKIDIFGYLKNFGIITVTIATLYGGFKFYDKINTIIPIVENIQEQQSILRTQTTDIQNEVFDIRMTVDEQMRAIENLGKKHNELLYIIPQITKENMRELLVPVQEELKKNDYVTRSDMSGKGSS